MYEICKTEWHVCKICTKKIQDLAKLYGGCGIYYTQVFSSHLKKDHDINLEEYFSKHIQRPLCCKDCNKICDITILKSSKFKWKRMCGRSEETKRWAETAKISRKGSGNPMYGKPAWNKGLGLEDPRVENVASKLRGKKLSEDHKKKLSETGRAFIAAGGKRGMSGKTHSAQSIEKMRENTLNLIKRGVFNQIRSKPHIKMYSILSDLNTKFEEEKRLHYWCFDFYLNDYDYYLEVDGDYFHSNPHTRWPNGPRTITQKKIKNNDILKNKYCEENKINLIRFWENDILNNEKEVIEKIKCLHQK